MAIREEGPEGRGGDLALDLDAPCCLYVYMHDLQWHQKKMSSSSITTNSQKLKSIKEQVVVS